MLSIVIPTLNEVSCLPATIVHTRRSADSRGRLELIVCDCDSTDGTADLARRLGIDRIVTGGSSRATAMNRGAAEARGEVLLFLHADSQLPHGFTTLIQRALTNPQIVGGAFDFTFAADETARRFDRYCLEWVILLNRARFRWTGNFYGDQSIFVRRDVFHRIGGFPEQELMEDIGFCRRMRRYGRTAILRPPVVTSPRRFLQYGILAQLLRDMTLLGFDSIGIHPTSMWRRYNQLNHCAHQLHAA